MIVFYHFLEPMNWNKGDEIYHFLEIKISLLKFKLKTQHRFCSVKWKESNRDDYWWNSIRIAVFLIVSGCLYSFEKIKSLNSERE
jgi:hypothetical protein